MVSKSPVDQFSGTIRWRKLVLLGALGLGALACGHPAEEEKFEVVKVPQETKDFNLPSLLWDKLLIEDPEQAELNKIKKVNEDETLQSRTVTLSPLAVELIEKNQGVLTSPRIRIEFAKGGGTVDLAKFKGTRAGTFYVKFDFEGLNAPYFNIFFLSQGRARKVDGMVAGGGCRTFYNVTNAVVKDMKADGIPVNTTRDLHVSALAGHFFMSWLMGGTLSVTQVRFIDSSREDLLCSPLKTGGKQ